MNLGISASPGIRHYIMSQTFTPADVATHNTADKGLYIIVDSNVFDVTTFIDEHPGGAKILKRVAGKDASKQFWKVRHFPSDIRPRVGV
ncbi:unnamed protein product [Penicillium salamii]|uniref:Cytochrome b5 heme-binding domain-containing protein n=1 Tax=Penicillium salamii TaxID=1612424 RepID=A0A9W4I320_9EURO|nr:unnamed protein product [Penicillium salamii]CAG8269667.1 unnamed protein product [Penicillium salamii]